MKFSLIICTYNRPEALARLLNSVQEQELYPDEILVIDSSSSDSTSSLCTRGRFPNLFYYQVEEEHKGLTRQRNFGISKVSKGIKVVFFLDDDIVLTRNYFSQIIQTYKEHPRAIGVGGYILNEAVWRNLEDKKIRQGEFGHTGMVRALGSRNFLRKKLGLLSNKPPGVMPEFSHGLSVSFLPPVGEAFPVEFFMGGAGSFKYNILQQLKFSTFYEGYGLYEDLDYCIRASRLGELYVNTAAGLYHFHEEAGRPNKFEYGKMVIRNGWYVWRLKYPSPGFIAKFKWHTITILLTLIRLGNVFSTTDRKEALTESIGRIVGWWSLFLKRPRHE